MGAFGIIFLVAFLLIGLIAILILIMMPKKSSATAKCIHCDASDVMQVDRQMLDSRTIHNYGGGSMAGGDIRVQIDYDVTYRCKACHKTFNHKQTETS